MSSTNVNESPEQVGLEFIDALNDLNCTKPQITFLTMLADEASKHSSAIANSITEYAKTCPQVQRLPLLYLIDSIVKNVKGEYVKLFEMKLLNLFPSIFEKVDEKTRRKMYELRQTWNDIFRKSILFNLDVRVQALDPAWPVTAPTPSGLQSSAKSTTDKPKTIFVNPNILKSHGLSGTKAETLNKDVKLQELEKPNITLAKKCASSTARPSASSSSSSSSSNSAASQRAVLKGKGYVIKKKGDSLQSPHHTSATPPPSSATAVQSRVPPVVSSDKSVPVGCIHVNPSRISSTILAPQSRTVPTTSVATTAARDIRPAATTHRDPRTGADKDLRIATDRDPRAATDRDPRTAAVNRDPRLRTEQQRQRQTSDLPANAVLVPQAAVPKTTAVHRAPLPATVAVHKARQSSSVTVGAGVVSTSRKTVKEKVMLAEKDQLFKPDVSTKSYTTKSRTDNSVNNSKELKSKVREEKISSGDNKSGNDESVSSTASSNSDKEAKLKESRSRSSDREPTKGRDDIRRQEIRKELKKVDRKEVRREERHSSHSRVRKELSASPKRKESSSQKTRDRRSKERLSDEGLPVTSSAAMPSTTSSSLTSSTVPATGDNNTNASVYTVPKAVVTPIASSLLSTLHNVMSENANASTAATASLVTKTFASQLVSSTPSDSSTTAATDAFRSVDRDKCRKRNIRPRTTPSPEPAATEKPKQQSQEKNTEDHASDSDESDHYEANKPSPVIYSERKGTQHSTGGDVDLRMLNTGPKRLLPDQGSSGVHDLFGKVDVDLRTYGGAAKMPTPPAVAAVFAPSASLSDQDLRKSLAAPSFKESESQASNADKTEEAAKNWQNFREKNPDFKEYQRQCSTPAIFDISSPLPPADSAQVRAKIRRKLYGEEELEQEEQPHDSPDHETKTTENLQLIAQQAEEQLRDGQISILEYNATLHKVVGKYERDKVEKARERHRSMSVERETPPAAERSHSPHMRRPEPLRPPPMPPHLRGMHSRPNMNPYSKAYIGRFDEHEDVDLQMLDRNGLPIERFYDRELPFIPDSDLTRVIRENETRTIDIDKVPREIRTYGSTAIVLLDSFEPRSISFEEANIRIVFDEGQFVLPMNTLDDYKEFTIEGEPHRVRIGVPTQELFLDGRGYQCFFGGKPITIHFAGRPRTIRLVGAVPRVNIGKERNTDFLLGKITLVVNANTKRIHQLFLDAKPQKISFEGKPLIFRFREKFRTIEINSVPFNLDLGGLPLPITVKGRLKYLSFSGVPPHIVPGESDVLGLDTKNLFPSYPSIPLRSKQPVPHEPLQVSKLPLDDDVEPLTISDSGSKPVPETLVVDDDEDISVLPGSYSTKELQLMPPDAVSESVDAKVESMQVISHPPSQPKIDVEQLLTRLVNVGIIGKPDPGKKDTPDFKKFGAKPFIKVRNFEEMSKVSEHVDENDIDWIEKEDNTSIETRKSSDAKIDFLFKIQQLRRRSDPLVAWLYRGMQCASCGMRYPAEQTLHYSHHLDWHFRQNKREQESTKKASYRKFYIPIDDWLQYEEIEDVEERVPSMFETEANSEGGAGARGANGSDEEYEDEASVPVVSGVSSLGVCPVCHDTFSQFFKHDTDEWHYRDTVTKDGLNYHPTCYQDLVRQKEKAEEKKKEEEERRVEEEKRKTEEELLKASEIAKEDQEKQKEEEKAKIDEAKLKEEEKTKQQNEEQKADSVNQEVRPNSFEEANTHMVSAEQEQVSADSKADDKQSASISQGKSVVDAAAPTDFEADTGAEHNSEGNKDATSDTVTPDDKTPSLPEGSAEVPTPAALAISELRTETPEGTPSPAEPEKKKKKKKKKKQQPVLPIPIKEEPRDVDEFATDTRSFSGVRVKEEKLDEPEISEEAVLYDEGIDGMEQSPGEDDDLEPGLLIDTAGDSVASSQNQLMSNIEGNVETTEAAQVQPPSAVSVPRIRLALGNLASKLSSGTKEKPAAESADDEVMVEGVAEANESGEVGRQLPETTTQENGLVEDEGVDALDDDITWLEELEFTPPPFAPNLKNHPKFEGIEIKDAGVRRIGIEESALCSIM